MNKKEVVKSEGMSLKVTPDFLTRLNASAERVGISRSALAELAIEAAVRAIEASGNQLVLPVQFNVKQVPAFSFANKEESSSVWAEKLVEEVARYNREAGFRNPLVLVASKPMNSLLVEEEIGADDSSEEEYAQAEPSPSKSGFPAKS